MLYRSIDNPEVADTLPRVTAALAGLGRQGAARGAHLRRHGRGPEGGAEGPHHRLRGQAPELRGERLPHVPASTARNLQRAPSAARAKETLRQDRSRLGRSRHLDAIKDASGPMTRLLPALGARPAPERGRRDRPQLPGPGDLPRRLRPHLVDQPQRHAAVPRARLPGRLPARRRCRRAGATC